MKYALLHHAACAGEGFHYRIDRDGRLFRLLPEQAPGIHTGSIGIVVEGDFDRAPPEPDQLTALRELLVGLKMRYPAIRIGGHRQVRGDETRCPGAHFPLADLRSWAENDLPATRDQAFEEEINRQYRPF